MEPGVAGPSGSGTPAVRVMLRLYGAIASAERRLLLEAARK